MFITCLTLVSIVFLLSSVYKKREKIAQQTLLTDLQERGKTWKTGNINLICLLKEAEAVVKSSIDYEAKNSIIPYPTNLIRKQHLINEISGPLLELGLVLATDLINNKPKGRLHNFYQPIQVRRVLKRLNQTPYGKEIVYISIGAGLIDPFWETKIMEEIRRLQKKGLFMEKTPVRAPEEATIFGTYQ